VFTINVKELLFIVQKALPLFTDVGSIICPPGPFG
jgi:hypothetical protein